MSDGAVRRRASRLRGGFAEALRRRRADLGLSQEELADQAGLHRTYVSALERALKSPSLGAIEALAIALDMPAHELVKVAESLSFPDSGTD